MGQKYFAYDDTGKFIGFYDDSVCPLPAGVPAIPISDAEWTACAANISKYIVDLTTRTLADAPPVDPAIVLADAKSSVKADIRKERDDLLLLTPFNGKVFQTDTNSKIQIMVIAQQAALLPSAAKWRTADNSYADMTLDLFKQLMAAIMTREGQAFANSAAHQDAVDALLTVDAVSGYDFSGGWPE